MDQGKEGENQTPNKLGSHRNPDKFLHVNQQVQPQPSAKILHRDKIHQAKDLIDPEHLEPRPNETIVEQPIGNWHRGTFLRVMTVGLRGLGDAGGSSSLDESTFHPTGERVNATRVPSLGEIGGAITIVVENIAHSSLSVDSSVLSSSCKVRTAECTTDSPCRTRQIDDDTFVLWRWCASCF